MPGASVGTTAVRLVNANRDRKSLYIANNHATAKVYLRSFKYSQDAPTSTESEFIIGPGIERSFTVTEDSAEMIRGAWQVISDTASTPIIWGET